ncbi:hypothetical protein PR048_022275 [Dryococelus australis]|uniref:Uncharacterized protein n=1 Tax=Dryococelus australis TaxID=614101 RepID=A0ABQ9H0L0_9NEOP|nr:hypothetical protein PR048_022275 [Dryococelus australis]
MRCIVPLLENSRHVAKVGGEHGNRSATVVPGNLDIWIGGRTHVLPNASPRGETSACTSKSSRTRQQNSVAGQQYDGVPLATQHLVTHLAARPIGNLPQNAAANRTSGQFPELRICDNIFISLSIRATVAERLARSPLTKANLVQSPSGSPDFRKWESCRTMPLVGGFSWGYPVSPTPSLRVHDVHTNKILSQGSRKCSLYREQPIQSSQGSLPRASSAVISSRKWFTTGTLGSANTRAHVGRWEGVERRAQGTDFLVPRRVRAECPREASGFDSRRACNPPSPPGSPPRTRESCRTVALVGGVFSGIFASLALAFRSCFMLTSLHPRFTFKIHSKTNPYQSFILGTTAAYDPIFNACLQVGVIAFLGQTRRSSFVHSTIWFRDNCKKIYEILLSLTNVVHTASGSTSDIIAAVVSIPAVGGTERCDRPPLVAGVSSSSAQKAGEPFKRPFVQLRKPRCKFLSGFERFIMIKTAVETEQLIRSEKFWCPFLRRVLGRMSAERRWNEPLRNQQHLCPWAPDAAGHIRKLLLTAKRALLKALHKTYFSPHSVSSHHAGGRGDAVVRRLAFHPGSIELDLQRDHPRILACENRNGPCRWLAGFLGSLAFPPPSHSSAAPYSPHTVAAWKYDEGTARQFTASADIIEAMAHLMHVAMSPLCRERGKQLQANGRLNPFQNDDVICDSSPERSTVTGKLGDQLVMVRAPPKNPDISLRCFRQLGQEDGRWPGGGLEPGSSRMRVPVGYHCATSLGVKARSLPLPRSATTNRLRHGRSAMKVVHVTKQKTSKLPCVCLLQPLGRCDIDRARARFIVNSLYQHSGIFQLEDFNSSVPVDSWLIFNRRVPKYTTCMHLLRPPPPNKHNLLNEYDIRPLSATGNGIVSLRLHISHSTLRPLQLPRAVWAQQQTPAFSHTVANQMQGPLLESRAANRRLGMTASSFRLLCTYLLNDWRLLCPRHPDDEDKTLSCLAAPLYFRKLLEIIPSGRGLRLGIGDSRLPSYAMSHVPAKFPSFSQKTFKIARNSPQNRPNFANFPLPTKIDFMVLHFAQFPPTTLQCGVRHVWVCGILGFHHSTCIVVGCLWVLPTDITIFPSCRKRAHPEHASCQIRNTDVTPDDEKGRIEACGIVPATHGLPVSDTLTTRPPLNDKC